MCRYILVDTVGHEELAEALGGKVVDLRGVGVNLSAQQHGVKA